MSPKPYNPSRWLYIRNMGLGALALVVGMGTILFGLNSWWNLLWVMPVWILCLGVWQMVQTTHPRRALIIRRASPGQFSMEYEQVHFAARDGVELSAYYLKGTRPETVMLVHGLGGGGVTLCIHGRALQKSGFNVLLPDLRGHGHSAGNTIDGVQEINDILGAVDYLKTRPEVDAGRIGALGISLGARTVLHAALKTDALRALILEGLGPNGLEDHGGAPLTLRRKINYPINWLTYQLGDFIAGTRVESNTSALKRLRRPLLVISTGRGKEQHFTRILFAAALPPKELWEIPSAQHAGGYFADSHAYAQRMVGFFTENLK